MDSGENMNTNDLTRISLLTTMIAIGAFIKIPAPVVGSFTLQLTFVILAGILLGRRNGAIAAAVYVFGGLVGIPWFAMGGGFGYILKPTFGFILAFIVGAYITGAFREMAEKKLGYVDVRWVAAGAIISTVLVWIIGMLYLAVIYQHVLGQAFGYTAALLSILSPSFIADMVLALVISGVGVRIYQGVVYTRKGEDRL